MTELVQKHVLQGKMLQLVKDAYDKKDSALKLIKGDKTARLPLEVFLQGVETQIIQGSLRKLIALTSDESCPEYVSGY